MNLNLTESERARLADANLDAFFAYINALVDNPELATPDLNNTTIFVATDDPWVNVQNEILAAQAEAEGEVVCRVTIPSEDIQNSSNFDKGSTFVVFASTSNGRDAFKEWLDSISSEQVKAKIAARIRRMMLGDLRNYTSLGKGLFELRVNSGSDYRIYFAQVGTAVVLLDGGSKTTQEQDVKRIKEYWASYDKREFAKPQ
ncbi:MAG: type II toxin-antitoxin system RelE/ParE family toxin [Leptolyngbyaceae cyanobacterium bins.302]|nr:type II toxin-antitoxin system RelE/ParE family toxin [Leptolyngbyaceae cyanobacterium bins.302]